jgi:hypothetical protein
LGKGGVNFRVGGGWIDTTTRGWFAFERRRSTVGDFVDNESAKELSNKKNDNKRRDFIAVDVDAYGSRVIVSFEIKVPRQFERQRKSVSLCLMLDPKKIFAIKEKLFLSVETSSLP